MLEVLGGFPPGAEAPSREAPGGDTEGHGQREPRRQPECPCRALAPEQRLRGEQPGAGEK